MNSKGQTTTHFKLSELTPERSGWGHSAYISLEPDAPLDIGKKDELVIFFTPRNGTTFEQVERLIGEMNKVIANVHFNIFARTNN